eukprot:CAMPEP_0178922812 /NCGR_PEP_ID=MMETSP0786-20121207/16366_1 /TAXON_ID=186022 /ORGANISM="Thalassionema frauenfeldii, Strain CCMP 1798" /LENGTH=35 /DNA_ID= /DNA_START= /DNA_END= /DNA_ORIENTATION=
MPKFSHAASEDAINAEAQKFQACLWLMNQLQALKI